MKTVENSKNESKESDLIFYYNSTDTDVTLARELIDHLSEMGLTLSNEHKNYIIKDVQQIYGAGASYGQARIKEILVKRYRNLLEQFIADINRY